MKSAFSLLIRQHQKEYLGHCQSGCRRGEKLCSFNKEGLLNLSQIFRKNKADNMDTHLMKKRHSGCNFPENRFTMQNGLGKLEKR